MLLISAFLILVASRNRNETKNQPNRLDNDKQQAGRQEAVGFGPFWSEYDMWI
ncbi:MAG: hypothetical protein AAGF26_02995 [Cyanobacteria bacterium P01_G01_bin.49]